MAPKLGYLLPDDCYCYLPLNIFCGDHLLAAKLGRSDIYASACGAADEVARIVGQIRARWPDIEIVLRADSGFARETLMAWCEANGSTMSSAWRPTRGSRPACNPPWTGPRRARARANSPPACSPSSATEP